MLAAWLSRPLTVWAFALSLLCAGFWAAFRVPLEWMPQIELPTVQVAAQWSGASPRNMEQYVTAVIERAVQDVPGTARIESLSSEGRAYLTLHVAQTADLGSYVAEVNERLAQARSVLPPRVQPSLSREVPEALREQQGFMTLQLRGPQTPDLLRQTADQLIAPRLRRLSDLASVKVQGGTQKELLISLKPEALSAYHVSPARIQQQVQDVLEPHVFGRLRNGSTSTLLMSPAANSANIFQDLRLKTASGANIPFTQFANIQRQAAPQTSISRVDGQDMVTLLLDRTKGSHLLETAQTVHRLLPSLQAKLPKGTILEVVEDRSEAISEQLSQLAVQGSLGLLLVILVLVFMLRSLYALSLVLLSVFCALSCTLLLFIPFDLSLNVLTLGGLVLVFGLLVDNAVVVVELLMQEKSRFSHTFSQSIEGAVQITQTVWQLAWLPLLGSTLTTIIVLLPLLYLSGDLKTLLLPFIAIITLTLFFSLVFALGVLPVLGRWLPSSSALKPTSNPKRRWGLRGFATRFAGKRPHWVLWGFILAFGLPLWLLPETIKIPKDGFPNAVQTSLATTYNTWMAEETVYETFLWVKTYLGGISGLFYSEGNFGQMWKGNITPDLTVLLGFPPGTPIVRADSLLATFEQTALQSPYVNRTIARITEQEGILQVKFHPRYHNLAAPFLVREALIKQAVLMAGIQVSIIGLAPEGYSSGFAGMISGLTIQAYGPNYEELNMVMNQFATKLKENVRVAEVGVNVGQRRDMETREALRYKWTPDAQLRTKLTAASVANALNPVFNTRFPRLYADLDDETQLPIRIEVSGAHKIDIAQLATQALPLQDSTQVQLGQFAQFKTETLPPDIERIDQQYKGYMAIDYRGPYDLGVRFMEDSIAETAFPPGYRIELNRYSPFSEREQKNLIWVFLGGIFLIYLVMVLVFESWRTPYWALWAIPSALFGLALGFYLLEASFEQGALLGALLLAGTCVNNGILLLATYHDVMQQSPQRNPILVMRLAVRWRFRAMWTTTLTSVVGVIPVLLADKTDDFWLGLATSVGFGLTFATLLTPLLFTALVARSIKRPSFSFLDLKSKNKDQA